MESSIVEPKQGISTSSSQEEGNPRAATSVGEGPPVPGADRLLLSPQDVLLGRGIGPNDHPGNVAFRKVVLAYRDEYMATKNRSLKDKISRRIISTVRDNGGRFVKSLRDNNEEAGAALGPEQEHFVSVITDDKVVIEKTKQALRFCCRKRKASATADPGAATAPPSSSRRSTDVPDAGSASEVSETPIRRVRPSRQQDGEGSEQNSTNQDQSLGLVNQPQYASPVAGAASVEREGSVARGGASSVMTNISNVHFPSEATRRRLYNINTNHSTDFAPGAYLPSSAAGRLTGNPTQSLSHLSSVQQGEQQDIDSTNALLPGMADLPASSAVASSLSTVHPLLQQLLGRRAPFPIGLTAGVNPSPSIQQLPSATAYEQRLQQLQQLDNALLASNLANMAQPQLPLIVGHPFPPPLLSNAAEVTAGTYVSPGVGVLNQSLGIAALGNGLSGLAPVNNAQLVSFQRQPSLVRPAGGGGTPLFPFLPLGHLPSLGGPFVPTTMGNRGLPQGSGERGDTQDTAGEFVSTNRQGAAESSQNLLQMSQSNNVSDLSTSLQPSADHRTENRRDET